jgi:hypothetical protein
MAHQSSALILEIAFSPAFRYSATMSTLPLELGAELDTLDPADAQHIQRAVREMIQLVKRKRAAGKAPLPKTAAKPYITEASPLGLKLGQDSHSWTEWLDEAEGPGWK